MRQLRSAGWILAALLWGTAVYAWPRLRVDNSEASRNWQATADVTLATIIGTIVVLVLTVGLLAVQMLSPYGWRATRMLVNRSFYAATAAVLAGGVIAPVWIAANPSPTWTRIAFLGFGWSLLLIAAIGTSVVLRMSPQALVQVVVSRARTTSARVLSRKPVLEAETEVLIELFGSPALPDSCRQQVADGICHTMAMKRGDDFNNHLVALTTATEQLTSSTQLSAMVRLLRQLTEDHGTSSGIRSTAEQSIRRIADDARLAGKRDVASLALNALAALTRSWVIQNSPDNTAPGPVTYSAESTTRDLGYHLIEETVAVLHSHLSAPHPSSTGWPDGWQGTSAFEEDVKRIADLPIDLYDANLQMASDAAEQALADIAQRLGDEMRPVDLVAGLLGEAMLAAFKAGFDKRAMNTGRLLIEATTNAVERGDQSAAAIYLRVLRERVSAISNPIFSRNTKAHRSREIVFLTYVLKRAVPLLAVGLRDAIAFDEINTSVDRIARQAYPAMRLECIAWQAKLAAAGWPVASISGSGLPTPLPRMLLEAVEQHLKIYPRSNPLRATLVMALWANAAAPISNGNAHLHLREVITAVAEGKRDDQVTALLRSAIAWTDAVGQRPTVPKHNGHAAPGIPVLDRTYHGLIEGANAVLVVESDGSHRLLRTDDGSATDDFTWGYAGTGPQTLAETLVHDCMTDMVTCLDCLGTAPIAVGLVTCAGCDNTGYRIDPSEVAAHLVERVIQHLPGLPGAEPTWPGAEWTVTSEVLAHVVRQL